jgi:hypothetical protein
MLNDDWKIYVLKDRVLKMYYTGETYMNGGVMYALTTKDIGESKKYKYKKKAINACKKSWKKIENFHAEVFEVRNDCSEKLVFNRYEEEV